MTKDTKEPQGTETPVTVETGIDGQHDTFDDVEIVTDGSGRHAPVTDRDVSGLETIASEATPIPFTSSNNYVMLIGMNYGTDRVIETLREAHRQGISTSEVTLVLLDSSYAANDLLEKVVLDSSWENNMSIFDGFTVTNPSQIARIVYDANVTIRVGDGKKVVEDLVNAIEKSGLPHKVIDKSDIKLASITSEMPGYNVIRVELDSLLTAPNNVKFKAALRDATQASLVSKRGYIDMKLELSRAEKDTYINASLLHKEMKREGISFTSNVDEKLSAYSKKLVAYMTKLNDSFKEVLMIKKEQEDDKGIAKWQSKFLKYTQEVQKPDVCDDGMRLLRLYFDAREVATKWGLGNRFSNFLDEIKSMQDDYMGVLSDRYNSIMADDNFDQSGKDHILGRFDVLKDAKTTYDKQLKRDVIATQIGSAYMLDAVALSLYFASKGKAVKIGPGTAERHPNTAIVDSRYAAEKGVGEVLEHVHRILEKRLSNFVKVESKYF